jgi:small-conductance mechanosensitive channel
MPDIVTMTDNQTLLQWLLILGLGFPALLLLLGEIGLRLKRRGNSLAVPIHIVRNFFLPTVVLFLLLTQVLSLPGDTVPVRMVATLLWIFLIYAALLIVNIVLFEEARPGTWQANVPKLFLDLSRFFLILVGAAIVLSTVWEADLGGLITALGVGSLVIGLALQDSLGNIFSGIALLFERPVSVGDWIEINGEIGRVIDVNWRSVHLQTLRRDLQVVPNSQMASSTFKNFSRPTPMHVETFEMRFSFHDPPYKVRQILYDTAMATEGVLHDPAPIIRTTGYGDFSITYLTIMFFENFERSLGCPDTFINRLWYAAKRHQLTIPYPVRAEYAYQTPGPSPQDELDQAMDVLNSMPLLRSLDQQVIQDIGRSGTLKTYASDEVVLSPGEQVLGMYFVIQGHLEMVFDDATGKRHRLSTLAPGEFFGEEASLLGQQISRVSVIALNDVKLLLMNETLLEKLVDSNPYLATEIGEMMELRRRSMKILELPEKDFSKTIL